MPREGDGSEADAQAQQAGDQVVEPSSLCCPVMQTLFRDPVFVPDSGNTYERDALMTFWRASQMAAAPPRDPLNNTVLTSTQVFVNWDKRREVAAWLQDNPGYVPSGWAGRSDIPPADPQAHARAAHPAQAPGHRHIHVEFNMNLQLTGRHLGTFAVVAASLICGLGLHELAYSSSSSSPGSRGTEAAAAAVAAAQQHQTTFILPSSSPFLKMQQEIDTILRTRTRVTANDFAAFGGNALLTEASDREHLVQHLLDLGYLARNAAVYSVVYPSQGRFLRQVPDGSRVKVATTPADKGNPGAESMTVFVPPLPARDVEFADLASAIFVLIFIFIWTKASSQGAPFLFVLFSAPFWYTGGMLLRKAVIRQVETSSLHVTRQHLVISEDWGGRFSRTSQVELQFIHNFQVKTKLIVNGQPQGVLEIREQEALHEWGSSLSINELHFVHRQVVQYLAHADKGASAQGARGRDAQAVYLPGGQLWTLGMDSPFRKHTEALNRILLGKLATNQVVTPDDLVAHEGQVLLPDASDRSQLFDELRAKGYVVPDDQGDFRVRMLQSA